ncbi:MAG: HlyD family efflux transporter periplasmic adaptor subunit, partial [Balneolales bacterium]
MDRKLEKKLITPRKVLMFLSIPLLAFLFIFAFWSGSGESRLNVNAERITISTVEQEPFQEYIPVNGTVIPIRTIYIGALEGGRIERVLNEGGSMLEAGDTILTLTNSNFQLDVFNREAQILEQINNLQNTRLNLQQQRLRLREQVLDQEYQLKQRERDYKQNIGLYDKKLLSEKEYIESKEAFEQTTSQLHLLSETQRLDSLATENQLRHIDTSLDWMMLNLDIVKNSIDNLVITAPISGQLTSLDAEIGESKARGERLGQIDVLDGYKVRLSIDEHYITRINPGQRGVFDLGGETYELIISKIFPEVDEGRFDVDMEFTGEEPGNIRRGQTLRVRMELGDLTEATLLARGGFYQQ